jgi:hypothetical protein
VRLDAAGMLGEPVTDHAGAVGEGAVHDEVHLAVEVADEPVREAAHHLRVEGLGEHHEVHTALRADRGDGVHREPVAAATHDRGAALLAPGYGR